MLHLLKKLLISGFFFFAVVSICSPPFFCTSAKIRGPRNDQYRSNINNSIVVKLRRYDFRFSSFPWDRRGEETRTDTFQSKTRLMPGGNHLGSIRCCSSPTTNASNNTASFTKARQCLVQVCLLIFDPPNGCNCSFRGSWPTCLFLYFFR